MIVELYLYKTFPIFQH